MASIPIWRMCDALVSCSWLVTYRSFNIHLMGFVGVRDINYAIRVFYKGFEDRLSGSGICVRSCVWAGGPSCELIVSLCGSSSILSDDEWIRVVFLLGR
jgi:hypothetical protein